MQKIIRKRIKVPTYRYYRCGCGRELVPVTNPSKCPYCGRITRIV